MFHGGPWEDPSRLLPRLVAVGLKGEGVYPIIEALSELRMIAIADGREEHDSLDADEATEFLADVCVLNMDLMFLEPTEEVRLRPRPFQRAERLFRAIRNHISMEGFGHSLVEEIRLICAQRPIVTRRVRKLLDLAAQLPTETVDDWVRERVEYYLRATHAVTETAAQAGDPESYLDLLQTLEEDQLLKEAKAFADSLHQTGLSSPMHTSLLAAIRARMPEHLPAALGLDDVGRASFFHATDFVLELLDAAVAPGMPNVVQGLARMLNRGLLLQPDLRKSLNRLLNVPILPEVEARVMSTITGEGLTIRRVLLAGTINVLGSPLGIGQGNNPTCQAARGLSLWSQHAPGLLLRMVATAVRNGHMKLDFEGHELVSSEPIDKETGNVVDTNLDPVSVILVPHLDKLYAQLLALAAGRKDDPHSWINPAMYGRWVSKGFAGAFNPVTGAVVNHKDFVRRFYASHHPHYNGGLDMIYPNPVGIIITDVHAKMLGYHAVSLHRVDRVPSGEWRAYFYNPNNEGRQRWGQGIAPTVSGHGEQPGESSLPVEEFVSRLYAFHYDPDETIEPSAVEDEIVENVTTLARESWGREKSWTDLDMSNPIFAGIAPAPTTPTT
ncbi:hypothetical protein GF324_12545 [bacterium]|nr:hypothetical protein [bacterium]